MNAPPSFMAHALLHRIGAKNCQEHYMWSINFFFLVSFVSLFNYLDSFGSNKKTNFEIYTHVIEVTDIDLDFPIHYPRPLDEDEMVAKKNN